MVGVVVWLCYTVRDDCACRGLDEPAGTSWVVVGAGGLLLADRRLFCYRVELCGWAGVARAERASSMCLVCAWV